MYVVINKNKTATHYVNMAKVKNGNNIKKQSGHPWYGGKSIQFKQTPMSKEIIVVHDQACVLLVQDAINNACEEL